MCARLHVCVAKLFDINAQLVEDQGFLEMLKETLSDSNPMVSLRHAWTLATPPTLPRCAEWLAVGLAQSPLLHHTRVFRTRVLYT